MARLKGLEGKGLIAKLSIGLACVSSVLAWAQTSDRDPSQSPAKAQNQRQREVLPTWAAPIQEMLEEEEYDAALNALRRATKQQNQALWHLLSAQVWLGKWDETEEEGEEERFTNNARNSLQQARRLATPADRKAFRSRFQTVEEELKEVLEDDEDEPSNPSQPVTREVSRPPLSGSKPGARRDSGVRWEAFSTQIDLKQGAGVDLETGDSDTGIVDLMLTGNQFVSQTGEFALVPANGVDALKKVDAIPARGYTSRVDVEATLGKIILLRLRDGRYAKLKIRQIEQGRRSHFSPLEPLFRLAADDGEKDDGLVERREDGDLVERRDDTSVNRRDGDEGLVQRRDDYLSLGIAYYLSEPPGRRVTSIPSLGIVIASEPRYARSGKGNRDVAPGLAGTWRLRVPGNFSPDPQQPGRLRTESFTPGANMGVLTVSVNGSYRWATGSKTVNGRLQRVRPGSVRSGVRYYAISDGRRTHLAVFDPQRRNSATDGLVVGVADGKRAK